MSKGLEALEIIKNAKLIDHVKIKEGLFSNKLLDYKRRYGKNVFSEQIPIIEKELKALEIIKRLFNRGLLKYSLEDLLYTKYITQEEYDLLKEVLL